MKQEPDSGLRRNDKERSEVIFFSEKKLARKLHEGQVTEKEQMIYLVLFNLIFAIFMTSSFSNSGDNPPFTLYTYLSDALMIATTIGAIIYSKMINDRGDGLNFLVRLICLSIPIDAKFIPLAFVLGIIAFMLDNWSLVSEENSDLSGENIYWGPYSFLSIFLVYVFYIWRLKVAFEIASGKVELK